MPVSGEHSEEDHPVKGPKEFIVEDPSDNTDSSPGLSSSEDEKRERPKIDIPPEYWHIQKLVKYMKAGNQTATVIALCCLKDHDLTTNEINQMAIQDIGGLEVLINLLETKDLKCKLGSLSVLKELSENQDIRRCITDLGGIPLLVQNISDPARDLQILVAETIYNVAKIGKARKHVRKAGGIPKLVDLLDVSEHCLMTPKEELSVDDAEYVDIARAAAKALWSVSRSRKNIQLMMKSGSVPLLARLLRSVHMEVIVPTVGTIAQCSVEPSYQLAIQTEGMIKDIAKHLNAEDAMLRTHCADTLYKCGEDATTRNLVRQAGGLDPLVQMAKDPATRENKNLLAAVTGAIWKTAMCPENVERYDTLRTVEVLVKLLENVDEDERVLSNVVGALCEFTKFKHNREVLRRCNGIPHLVNLLNYTYPPLLANVPMVLRECAQDEDSMRIIEQLDGVRLIWSLLKNDSPVVQANAAWSLVPNIRFATDSGEMVRCFVGGLELIVNLLKSTDCHVLACVCAAISEVAKDIENLAVITDHGVVPMLATLVNVDKNVELREHLASAIAHCSAWGSNCKTFGRLGAITPLVAYMADMEANVHRTTALALFHLSKNAFNCVSMHESGVVPFLLKAIATTDYDLQEAAAGCLANIRKLALEAETVHLIRNKNESSGDED